MKTYVLIVSRFFPKTHPAAGEPTNFIPNILAKVKKHTIRKNYDYWKKAVEEVQAGEAVISVRVWTADPYRSKQQQIEELQFRQGSQIGVEKLIISGANYIVEQPSGGQVTIPFKTLAVNDGLKPLDFMEWFDKPQKEPYAIIHFTPFRYAQGQLEESSGR
jgi:hypothetical protein